MYEKRDNRKQKPDVATLIYGKVPPQAKEFEIAVLGCCMDVNGRAIFEQVLGIIKSEECFYIDAHQKIFAALLRLFNKNMPIDFILVTEELRKTNELELVGGGAYLMSCVSKNVTDATVEYHCRVLMEKYLQREVIRICGTSTALAYEPTTEVFELLDKTSDDLYRLVSNNIQKAPMSILGGIYSVMNRMEEQKLAASDFTGITTGFKELDEITNGWQKTDLTILAARPSVGKTAFAIALVLNAAFAGHAVALFSLEMGIGQIIQRLIAAISGVEMNAINRPKMLTPSEWDRVTQASNTISKLQIVIDDSAGLTEQELRAKVRNLKQKHNTQLVIIDYLQLMSGTGKEGSREQEVSRISRGIKTMSKDCDVATIALSQLNRSMEGGTGEAKREPRLSDLRESGAIEQDADNVLFISEPTPAFTQAHPFFLGKKVITIAKGRNIGTGFIALEFNKDTQKWRDPDKGGPLFNEKTPSQGGWRPLTSQESKDAAAGDTPF